VSTAPLCGPVAAGSVQVTSNGTNGVTGAAKRIRSEVAEHDRTSAREALGRASRWDPTAQAPRGWAGGRCRCKGIAARSGDRSGFAARRRSRSVAPRRADLAIRFLDGKLARR